MKVFFDTRFTGTHQNTTIISIGLINEIGQTFYAEFGDFDNLQVNVKIRQDILTFLKFHHSEHKGWCNCSTQNAETVMEKTEVYGHKKFISECLENWFSKYDKIEMWSDKTTYNWMLFCQLWGNNFNIPSNICKNPFDIYTLFKLRNIDPDTNREDFTKMKYNKINFGDFHHIKYNNKEYFAKNTKFNEFKSFDKFKSIKTYCNNALWSAKIIKKCYEKMVTYK